MMRSLLKEIRGLSLVMVVFAMMVLAVLGWTLAGMFSAGFQSNLGVLDSERALELAEAGIEESIRLIKNNDAAFDEDSDYLYRKLDYGEYNVTRQNATTVINITSSGYVPGINNYRAMRQVKVMLVAVSSMNALSGGYLFDWHNASPISVEGPIVSANFYGNDGNTDWNENSTDLNVPQPVPGQYERLRAQALIPAINMTWYLNHTDAINYTGDKSFSSYNGGSGAIVYVKGDVEIDLNTGKTHNFNKASIIAEGDIYINGSNNLKMVAHVNNPKNITYPNLATLNGNIIMNCDPCGTHEFDGLVYTQTGIVNLTNVETSQGKAMALIGNILELNGDIEVLCKDQKASKYIDLDNGFDAMPTNTILSWHEE
jgi:hypothetical protein